MADAIIKWAGGKRQMLNEIVPRLPKNYNRYFEPFFGGGAVFFSIEPENGHINDINPHLMNFYRQVKRNPEQIIAGNKGLDKTTADMKSDEDREEFYYERRDEFNELGQKGQRGDKVREAALFLYLNRTCWNGLYRTNRDGEFNVPVGSKPTPVTAIESQIRRGHRALQSTNISSDDYAYIRELVQEDDLVFLDPPYPAESKTAKFNKYYEGRFENDNQADIRDLVIELHARGVHVLLTNGPSAIELYKNSDLPEEFRIQHISGKRTINSDASKRAELGTTDMIVTNIPSFGTQRTFDDFR